VYPGALRLGLVKKFDKFLSDDGFLEDSGDKTRIPIFLIDEGF
jgi:hypothetical protein